MTNGIRRFFTLIIFIRKKMSLVALPAEAAVQAGIARNFFKNV